ncbi:activating transcription factor 7-interacting protein 2 [Dunckerocampus dactyliophorus]|uniref:activating transcription factor 7-interacting protein 2 n=1 Tax=Dunckerocampus dactyliophorus TaxID=161453 RepID=UPI0024070F08|nr:activating transcription factor 7-interacting protein 2 [Dunckerocampus dactyliophorus]
MKRLLPESDESGNWKKKLKFSQSELQAMIEQEVQKAVRVRNSRLQFLTETIQLLQHDIHYESTIRKLEARIDTITKRAKAALAAMKSEKQSASFVDGEVINLDSDEESMPEEIKHNKTKKNCLIEIMETTKSSLQRMHAENQAIMSAMADLSKSTPVSEMKQMKAQPISHSKSNSVQHTSSHQDEPPYPPLPLNPFPSVLNMEAASYNIPGKMTVHLALIKQPASLSVMWNGDEKDTSLPPMESYSILLTMEKVKGSRVFPAWRTLGTVLAKPLPMCVSITKYNPGHKLCVAVVGKDIYGRYGPYSDVVSAVIPE